MTVNDIKATLKCKVFAGEELLDREVHTACGSDMMSDVLAYVKDQSILLTGLVNDGHALRRVGARKTAD